MMEGKGRVRRESPDPDGPVRGLGFRRIMRSMSPITLASSAWQIIPRVKDAFRGYAWAQRAYRFVYWHLRLRFAAAPVAVAIETVAECNRGCDYCPVSVHTREGAMPRELYDKIIEDLVEVGFTKTLTFHHYNEPLLDSRLPDLVAHAHARLPQCTLEIFTNGDLLTREWVQQLRGAGVRTIRVSLHSANSEKHLRRMLETCLDDERAMVTWEEFFNRQETGGFLYNRVEMAAMIPLRDVTQRAVRGIGCSAVQVMQVDYLGKTALCCNDFHASDGHGSLATMSVRDLWRQSRPARGQVYRGFFSKPICKTCVNGPTP